MKVCEDFNQDNVKDDIGDVEPEQISKCGRPVTSGRACLPRVAYWTSTFRQRDEALAAEIACLRHANPGSVVWGISRRDWGNFSWRSGFSVHPRFHLVFRGLTRVLQKCFQLNHIFGGLGDWFHLVSVHKSPVVMTLAVQGPPCDVGLLGRVDEFVVEWPAARDELARLGVESAHIRLIFPPADLSRFTPSCPPDTPFTVLFASSPDRADWLDARGVNLVLLVAKLHPKMRFRLIWRSWGNSLVELRRRIAEMELKNVEVLAERVHDMRTQYQRAHCTVAPFVDMNCCKPAPNSVVESLACGRPVVLTHQVGLAEVVAEHRAGVACEANVSSLADALECVSRDWSEFSRSARDLAERHFDQRQFIRAYQQLYSQLI